jgi:hypothetical protein
MIATTMLASGMTSSTVSNSAAALKSPRINAKTAAPFTATYSPLPRPAVVDIL